MPPVLLRCAMAIVCKNRVVIGVSGESMIFTPGLYADTYVIPLRDVAVVERSNNDAKVRLLIRSSGRSFTVA